MANPVLGVSRVSQLGNFSQRVSRPIGGSADSAPFEGFPIHPGPMTMRQWFQISNDFTQLTDFDAGITWTGGTNDWIGSDIGVVASSANALQTDVSYGILRVTAGTADATGRQVTRSASGSNVAAMLPWSSTSGAIVSCGWRFRVNETGTANESAILLGWVRDENATLTTTGAIVGAGIFGFTKAVGSASLTAFSRNTATLAASSAATITPGTYIEAALRLRALGTAAGQHIVEYYINGSYIGHATNTTSTQVPATDSYAPVFAVVNGTGCDATLDVDYYWAITARS